MIAQSSRLSLEQLRKQAKELLRAHRAADPDALARLPQPTPQLADAQHALAKELGYLNWAALVRQCRSHPPGLDRFLSLVDAVAAAYTSGDREAIRNVNGLHGTAFVSERELDRMQQRLPTWYAASNRTPELAHADARKLVARQSGFNTWEELVRSLAPTPKRRVREVHTVAPFVRFDADANTVEVTGILAEPHWDTVRSVLLETGATGLRAGGMTDEGIQRLEGLEQLVHLNFDGAGQLSDQGLQSLATLPHIQSLNLSGFRSQWTDAGLSVLSALAELRTVALCWAPNLTDAGIAHLKLCERLESVDLMGTHTGDGALRTLAGKQALTDLKTGRQVTDAGLTLLHEIPLFRTRTEPPSGQQAALLLDGPFTDGGLTALAGLDGLRRLTFFWHTPAITSAGLSALTALPHLHAFGCSGALCDDVAMGHIARLPALQDLHVQGTVATDEGFVALSHSQTLESLWGRECPNMTGRGFAALANLPRLQKLCVSCKHVDPVALARLPAFPQLRELTSMDISDDGFQYVGRCSGLESLLCMYCRDTSDAATGHLSTLPNLKYYYAGMTRITDASLTTLSRLAMLETLEFWQIADISDAGIAQLKSLPHLRRVIVNGSPNVTRAAADLLGPNVRVIVTG